MTTYKFLVIILMVFCVQAFAQEKGLDPITKVSKADLLCGKVRGKYIIFSATEKRIWYLISNPKLAKQLKSVTTSHELEGYEAYEYTVSRKDTPFPTVTNKGSSVAVQFIYDPPSINFSLLYVRLDSTGKYRLFQGEDGSNGLCRFLDQN